MRSPNTFLSGLFFLRIIILIFEEVIPLSVRSTRMYGKVPVSEARFTVHVNHDNHEYVIKTMKGVEFITSGCHI